LMAYTIESLAISSAFVKVHRAGLWPKVRDQGWGDGRSF
jgi:hypothetical protein